MQLALDSKAGILGMRCSSTAAAGDLPSTLSATRLH